MTRRIFSKLSRVNRLLREAHWMRIARTKRKTRRAKVRR